MGRSFFFARKKSSALHHYIYTKLAPGQLSGIAIGQHANTIAIDHHILAFHRHRARKLSVGGVIASEVSIGIRVAQVIDSHNL